MLDYPVGYFNPEPGFLPPHPELSRSSPLFSIWGVGTSCPLILSRGWGQSFPGLTQVAAALAARGRPPSPSPPLPPPLLPFVPPQLSPRGLCWRSGSRTAKDAGGRRGRPSSGWGSAGVTRLARSGAEKSCAAEWAGPRGAVWARGRWAGRAAGPRVGGAGRALGPPRSPLLNSQGGVYGRAASLAGAGPEAAAAPFAGEEPGAGRRAAGGDSGPRRGVPERRRRRRQRRQSRLGAWVRGGSGSARGLRCGRPGSSPPLPAAAAAVIGWKMALGGWKS